MKKLKSIDYKILSELIKNSKISDRKLSHKVKVSQPTVTRRRAALEKRQLLEYTAAPNFLELGFEIMAFSFAHWKPEALTNTDSKEYIQKTSEFTAKSPNIIFVSTGQGMGMDRVFISLHKNYADYANFTRELKEEWGKFLTTFDAFIVSLRSDNILRQLSFRYLAEYIQDMNKDSL